MMDVADVLAEETIEFRIIFGGMFITEPPEPIASFSNQNFFVRFFYLFFFLRFIDNRIIDKIARFFQEVPRAVVFGMAYPDVEIVVDPRSWKQARQRSGHMLIGVFLDRCRLDEAIVRKF